LVRNCGCSPIESTSKSAFNKVEPKLKELKTRENIHSKLEWHNLTLRDQGEKEYFSYANGWIGPLSGNHLGGWFGLGQITGRLGDKIFGEHVFGYLQFGTTIVPRYLVITEAHLIQPSEYHELAQTNYHNVGWLPTPGQPSGMPPKTQYKNVLIKEVRMLDFDIQEVDFSDPDIKVENGFSLRDILKSHMTPDRFHEAEKKLREMEKGTDVWDVVKKLNGNYFTPNSGIGYALLMDGYLNYKGGSWHKMTSNGLFLVWPFGYLDGETEVPKLSLIFKNGKLYKLVEYAAKAEIERVFAD